MSYSLLTLAQAAQLLKMTQGELRSLAVQGELPCEQRGEQMMFRQEDLDLWTSRRIIEQPQNIDNAPLPPQKQRRQFSKLSELCPIECISAALEGTTRASIIRELTKLADNSGFLYDPNDLRDAITKREEQGSTNVGNGIAIPHPLIREETVFSQSFVCIAKLAKPSFFNSAFDGLPTEILILACSADSEEHLHILRQISLLCRNSTFIESVKNAHTAAEIHDALLQAETN